MPSREPKRRRSGADRLVPVSGRHVQDLLRVLGLSEREAAAALRKRGVAMARATLDHVINGRQSRCRRSVRDGLVALLPMPIPVEWLDGNHHLEVSGGWDLNYRATAESPLGRAADAERERLGLPRRGAGLPPYYELVAYQLVKELEAAGVHEADAQGFVRRFLSFRLWSMLLVPDAAGEIAREDELNEFAGLMAQAVNRVLRVSQKRRPPVRAAGLARASAALAELEAAALAAGEVRRNVLLRQRDEAEPPEQRELGPAPKYGRRTR